MQLYAYEKNTLVYVDDAKKGVSYTCCDCGQEVRLRGGRFVTNHFFHVKPPKKCEYRRRSSHHLAIQHAIVNAFPKGAIGLEEEVEEGRRKADAIWREGKIVFEVQCSPITTMEVISRENDYAGMGYQVVWILSDKRFNKRRVSPAEKEIRKRSSYYSNHGTRLGGIFYDQFEIFKYFYRVKKFVPLRVNLRKPCIMSKVGPPLPDVVKPRVKNSKFYFQGDIYDRCMRHKAFREALIEAEKKWRQTFLKRLKKEIEREKKDMYRYLLKQSYFQ